MCLPQAYAAFRPVGDGEVDGNVDRNAVQAPISKQAFLKNDALDTRFHHVALEADDDEVTLLLSNSKMATTSDLPAWLTSTRVVIPRSGILSARHWSPNDVVSSWPVDASRTGGQLFPNWVELECTPRNSPSSVVLISHVDSIKCSAPHRDHPSLHGCLIKVSERPWYASSNSWPRSIWIRKVKI